MKILFLHGWQSVPGGVKPSFLAQHGHEIINPALDDEDFDMAVRTAQAEYNRHRPDVIVGSSRGGAVAMNIESGSTPLVLLCPAWRRWGTTTTVKPGTVILHSEADDVIPIAESRELLRNSGLPESALIRVGTDHRLADPEPLKAMLEACESPASSSREEHHDEQRPEP
jgi:alpha-beta hydrolase superfamily lysophospholipase